MKSKKSAVEVEMKEMVILCNDIIDDGYLTTRDARKIVDLLSKGLVKIEELVISRDNWRTKFETSNADTTSPCIKSTNLEGKDED